MTIVFVGTAEKRTNSLAARINVEHKMRGSYKDHHTSESQPVYRKLFSHGLHGSKNNFFKIKICQRRDWETPLCSIMALARVNKVDRDFLHWHLLSFVCPLTNHVTLLFSHQSFSACKDGGYRE